MPDKNTINISGNGNQIGAISQGANSRASGTVNSGGVASPALDALVTTLNAYVQRIADTDDQADAQNAVNVIAKELAKGDQADSTKLEGRLNTLRNLSADAFEVALTTLLNPVAGFSVVVQKVAAKLRK